MSVPEQDLKVTPSAAWYLLPLLLWVIAAGLLVWAIAAVWSIFAAGVDPVENHSEISVPSDGLTIYTTDVFAGGDCTFTDESGTEYLLDTFSTDIEIDGSGPTYYGMGSTPDGMESGRYTLDCEGIGDQARLGIGERLDLGAVAITGVVGILLPILLGLVGLVVLIVLLVKRSNSKSRIRAMSSGYGYGPGSWSSGSMPPPPPPRGPPPPPPGGTPPPPS